jgi:hypothetical protein
MLLTMLINYYYETLYITHRPAENTAPSNYRNYFAYPRCRFVGKTAAD